MIVIAIRKDCIEVNLESVAKNLESQTYGYQGRVT